MNELFPHGRILFSSPGAAYDVKYKINHWMNPDQDKVDRHKAIEQWTELINTVIRLGAFTEVVSIPHPDGVFSANAGLVYKKQFIVSTFRHAERQIEEQYWTKWAKTLRLPNSFEPYFNIIHHINSVPFEGTGDALFVGDTLVCGWGFRTQYQAIQKIGYILKVEVIPVRLKDPRFYHLDTCFCPLTDKLVMYYPEAFANPEVIADRFDTIEVKQADAEMFACNAVVLGKSVVLPKNCFCTEKLLIEKGFIPYSIPMSEYIKAGGACKCLTLKFSD
jgi:N-dimethylarginine dimethylaminohydrolase